ncbi:hypothetical protein D3C80_2201800 [compost metagenome]
MRYALRPAGALAVCAPFDEVAHAAGLDAFRVEETLAVEMVGDGAGIIGIGGFHA